MTPQATIFNKVLVREFYKANASFFLLVIGLAAGFMRSVDHIYLAEFFISAPGALLMPVGVWLFYSYKVLRFDRDTLHRSENEFLYHTSLLPVPTQLLTIGNTTLMQLGIQLAYGLFLVLTALKHGQLQTLWLIVLVQLLLWIMCTVHFYFTLQHPNREQKISTLTRFFNRRLTKPYTLFFPEWIIRRETFMVAGTKVFSMLVLAGVAWLYGTDTYDARLLGMGVAVAFAANVNLVWHMHRFDNVHFVLGRNLPLSFFQRIKLFVITTSLLLVPETGVVITRFAQAVSIVDLGGAPMLGFGIFAFFYSSMFRRDRQPDELMSLVFYSSMGLIVLVLFKVPLWLLATLVWGGAVYLWRRYYYQYTASV